MEKTQVILNVRMQAVAGREQELEGRLLKLVEPTRSEPGCIAYDLHRSDEKPGLFMFCETFASQDALDAHLATPHFQAFAKGREQNDPVASVDVTKWLKLR
jgi:quinol monooxygenase YgiN